MTDRTPEFSRPFDVESLGQGARIVEIEARPEEREALARRFGILAISSFRAELELVRRRGDLIEAKGAFKALVEQRCVVTLESFESEVSGDIERRYVLQSSGLEEESFDPEAEDAPEILDGHAIDLGELAAEELALSLDPYPRRPGASLERSFFGPPGAKEEDDRREKPFAALARLKKESDG